LDDTIAELEQRLTSAENNSEKSRIMADLAWSVKYSDPAKAVQLGMEAMDLARSSGEPSVFPRASMAIAMGQLHMSHFEEAEKAGLAGLQHYKDEESLPGIRHALNVLGSIYSHWGKLGPALDNYLESSRVDRQLSSTPDPGIMSNIGSVYMRLGDYEKALDYFLEVSEIAAGMEGPADLKAAASLNLGEVYRSMEMYDEALERYQQGCEVCRSNDMKSYLATTCVNIGNIYVEKSDIIAAMENFEEALSIYNNLGDRLGAADVLQNMGESNLVMERPRIALSFFEEALLIYRELDSVDGASSSLLGVASCLYSTGRNEEALDRLHKAESAATENGIRPLLVRILGELSRAYESLGMTSEALKYARMEHSLERELHSERTEERLLRLRITHQVEKTRREAEIYKLRTEELVRDRDILEQAVSRRTLELERLMEEKEMTQHVRSQLEMELGRDRRLASLGEIAGGIAHDFRNLLSVISGNAELVMDGESLSKSSRERMKSIVDATVTGAALAGQLMSFGRQLPDERGPVNLNETVTSMAGMLERTVGEGIEISCVLDPSNPRIIGDRLQLENLLVNLVINARDAMRDGGMIEIRVSRLNAGEAGTPEGLFAASDPLVRLDVIDQGHGIMENDMDRIFDPFFTTKQKTGGSGLGLSVVHSIVVQHKGWIKVESAVNKGSTFSIFFPEDR